MSTDLNLAIETWNTEHATATAELETLEATLKADYNKYVDSLVAYVARVKAANDVRDGYVRVLGIEDVSNETRTRQCFVYDAKPPIENKAVNYLLDTINPVETKSPVSVGSCNTKSLMARKAD